MSDADPALNLNCSTQHEAGHGTSAASPPPIPHEETLKSVIAAFFFVYDRLGPRFLENVYAGALAIELRKRGHKVAREVSVPVFYEGTQIARYTMDFVVDDVVVLELKSTETVGVGDRRQLVNYLRCTNFDVGLLLHFGPRPRFHRFYIPQSNHRPRG
ncbi:MAG TPA: GxxExxY protein [Gemmatimonadaceae bacterium]|nr:GxxExxY protein [Gemmatimonadaceae bacterium]